MTGASGSLINADFAGCVENACSCINIGAEKVSLYILKTHNRRLFMAQSENLIAVEAHNTFPAHVKRNVPISVPLA